MANAAANLILYGKVPDLGWRRGAIPFAKNGLPKPNTLLIAGLERWAESLVYQIRQYADRKAVYTSVGSDYRTAAALLDRMQKTRQKETLESELGIVIPKTANELTAEEADRQAQRKTLTQYAEAYLTKKQKLGTDSIALYRDTIQPLITFTGKTHVEELTGQDVADWYDSLKAHGYAQRTCQTRYVAVRGFLKRCGVNVLELIDEDIHKRLRRKPDPHTEPYTVEQIKKLMDAADPYYRMVFLLLLSTGLRMREDDSDLQEEDRERRIATLTHLEGHGQFDVPLPFNWLEHQDGSNARSMDDGRDRTPSR